MTKKILWFSWKDKKNPRAGGAEIVNEELAKRLVSDGFEVKFIVAGFEGCKKKEIINGYEVIRVGNLWTVYFEAFRYYKNNLQGWADLVIDEVNTIPFFSKFYVKEKNLLLFYQLCREIWFYQMFFPLNWIGYILEPLYLRLINDRKVITISNSTKNDLLKYGFKADNIEIISVGTEIEPLENLDTIIKFDNPTILSLGAIRAMKRTKDILQAFNLAKKSIPNLQLIVAGDSNNPYGQRFLQELEKSDYKQDIQYLGKVSIDKKIELMQKTHLILVTSLKEGWGLIVTEANSQGTPAIVYNVDGLRDSVIDSRTGLICNTNTPQTLAKNITKLFSDQTLYDKLRQESYILSKSINFEQSYKDFKSIILY
jgi:glycosyltransferase involved in cell wall biosynthesis